MNEKLKHAFSRIVRRKVLLSSAFIDAEGESGVCAVVERCEKQAMAIAEKEGYKNPTVTRFWAPKYEPLEAPVRDKSAQTWRDIYPQLAVFTVIVRDCTNEDH